MKTLTALAVLLTGWLPIVAGAQAQWLVSPPFDQRQARPPRNPEQGVPIQPGDTFANEQKFRWVIGEVEIPAVIQKKPAAGQPVGLAINGGDGGEVWLDGVFQVRFDNDHPALVVVSTNAVVGAKARIAIQFYGKVQGGNKFDEANWVLVEPRRACEVLAVKADRQGVEVMPSRGLVGLSQGGGLADYEEATARKLRQGGFRWFRMDNVLTNVRKKNKAGELVYDWADLDKRVDFLAKLRADFILCASYMPQVLDAVPNHERQSAPKHYADWEELCYQAAKRCLERGRRVPFWEVWNEVNTGWLKPGPEDVGTEAFRRLYSEALGKEATDQEVVRRFEAYCKLYRATARGVRRADPDAKIGGPALASGPFENSERGHAFHGKGFARGLMLWCRQEKLPLDFVSWHEYFQAAEVLRKEADTFRGFLKEFPELKVESFMVTEWNEAWWADRPQDHELGAAWCANGLIRAFIPGGVDRPCFFYVKQGDQNFRGDYSLLMQNNVPKASFNMARLLNSLTDRMAAFPADDEVCVLAGGFDPVTYVLVNYRDRHNIRRLVEINPGWRSGFAGGMRRQCVIDGTHANVWNDAGDAELRMTTQRLTNDTLVYQTALAPHSITMVQWYSQRAWARLENDQQNSAWDRGRRDPLKIEARLRPDFNRLYFALEQACEVDSVKVVAAADAATNPVPHLYWSLVADPQSPPQSTRMIVYGIGVSGLRPNAPSRKAEPLQSGVTYRLLIEAADRKGTVDFCVP